MPWWEKTARDNMFDIGGVSWCRSDANVGAKDLVTRGITCLMHSLWTAMVGSYVENRSSQLLFELSRSSGSLLPRSSLVAGRCLCLGAIVEEQGRSWCERPSNERLGLPCLLVVNDGDPEHSEDWKQ